MEYNKPLPELNPWNRPFWEACRNHQLKMQRCTQCSRFWYPPGPVCPHCRSAEWDWAELSGRGVVWSVTTFHHNYFPGFADDIPYHVAFIMLEEEVPFLSNVVGVANDDVKIGMPVRVIFEDVTPAITLPKFAPIGVDDNVN